MSWSRQTDKEFPFYGCVGVFLDRKLETLHLYLTLLLCTGPLSSHSTVPDQAHYVCTDLDSAVHLASQPSLADLIENIWIVGGTQVYKVSL